MLLCTLLPSTDCTVLYSTTAFSLVITVLVEIMTVGNIYVLTWKVCKKRSRAAAPPAWWRPVQRPRGKRLIPERYVVGKRC
jgi:hypothetical protein